MFLAVQGLNFWLFHVGKDFSQWMIYTVYTYIFFEFLIREYILISALVESIELSPVSTELCIKLFYILLPYHQRLEKPWRFPQQRVAFDLGFYVISIPLVF